MITKERLKELIKQDATICNQYIDYNNDICYRFGKAFIVDTDSDGQHFILKVNGTNTTVIMSDTEDLFETKEDAEEYLKYGNITKTEELVMADWNDVKNTTYGYCGSFDDGTKEYTLSIKDGYVYVDMLDYYYPEHLVVHLFKKEFNRENYNEARDLFVKLFKGE